MASKGGIGRRNKRITLETPDLVGTDPLGGRARGEYSVYATVWASIEPFSGRERYYADKITAEVSHRVRFPYPLPGGQEVKPNHRVGLTGTSRQLRIEVVINPREANKDYELLCTEVEGD